MSTPCKTDAQKHSFRADISIDYVDPKHPARVIQHYKSEPAELKLELPGSYRNFCAECLFKTKVGFGLLRHREVSVQYILEVNKAKSSQTQSSQTLEITRDKWVEAQCYLLSEHPCRFKLTARTTRKPWSLAYDLYTKLPLIPGAFPAQPRGSFRPSHYCQNSTLPKDSRALDAAKNQKFGPRLTSLEVLPNQPRRPGDPDRSKTKRSDVPVDDQAVRKDKGPSWSQRLFELCVGRKARDTTGQLCTAALYAGIAPIVRTPSKDPRYVSRILDGGALGVIVPHMRSVQDAKDLIGSRSSTNGLPHFQYRSIPAKVANPVINEGTLVIPMIETLEWKAYILLIGTIDLIAETGIPSDYDNSRLTEAYETIIAVCKKAGIWVGVRGLHSSSVRWERTVMAATDGPILLAGATARAKVMAVLNSKVVKSRQIDETDVGNKA
ncbi:hypothetical protein D6C97_02332 [Aureobasidium pullulans]|nr:hypothetical protein D6C97_02332 [Aureobasidium pullulans]